MLARLQSQRKLLIAVALLGGVTMLPAQTAPVNPVVAEARRLTLAKQPDAAIRLLRSEIGRDPKNQELRLSLAGMFAETARFDEGLATLAEVPHDEPNSLTALVGFGYMSFRKGDRGKASESYRKAVEVSASDTRTISGMAGLYMQTGQFEIAEMIDEPLHRLRPDDPATSNNLAFALAEQSKDLDRALELVQAAIARLPNAYPIIDTLGWVYFKKGLLDEALTTLCRALAMQANSESVQGHVLKVLEKMPRVNPQQKQLRDWLRSDSDPEREAQVHELAIRLAK